MTVVLLLHPNFNCMTIPLVVPVKIFRTIPLCGNFSNHISRTFLNHSSHWFKLNGYINVNIHTKKNELNKKSFFYYLFLQIHTHENVLVLKSTNKVD